LIARRWTRAGGIGRGARGFLLLCLVLFGLAAMDSAAIAQTGSSAPSGKPLVVGAEPQVAGPIGEGHIGRAANLLEWVYRQLYAVQNWLALGVILLLGRFGGKLSARLRTPMVVGYLVVGVILGRSVLNVISEESTQKLELITDFGLGIVAFMIGTELSRRLIRRLGPRLLIIMVSESMAAFFVVALLVWGLSDLVFPVSGLAVAGALIFGAMAPASAPAGTVAVIQEYDAKGPLTSLLLGVVGLDDAFAIMIYAFAAAAAKMVLSAKATMFLAVVSGPCLEILGGLSVGAAVGVLLLLLLRCRRDRGDVLIFTLGAILLASGLANALGLSLILANLSVGAVLANLSPRDTEHAYNAVERISAPVYVLFFVVAGAHLDLGVLATLTLLGPVYVVGRATGLIGGAYLGATLSGAEPVTRRYLGLGILSQAGVAVGLALTVANEFRSPEYGQLGAQLAQLTINTIAATTIIFEIIGPITTKIALSRAGEISRAPKPRGEVS